VTVQAHTGSDEGTPDQGAGSPDAASSRRPRLLELRFSPTGLVVGGLFLAAAMFPSLVPRPPWAQGVIIGITVAFGYGIGAAAESLWRYLQVPAIRGRARTVVLVVLVGLVAWAVVRETWRYVGWQNDQRALIGMPPIGPGDWPVMALIAVVVFALLLVVGRGLRHLTARLIRLLGRKLPSRLSIVLGVAGTIALIWLLISGLLVDGFFATANAMFAPRNDINKTGVTGPPNSELRSGGPGSTVSWDSLGREGRAFVTMGPTAEQLAAASPGVPVKESASTPQGRADIILAELKRTDAFDRKVLVLATTTGSGFVQPEGIDPLEYLWHGDTAVAAIQYSYLPSWLSLLADQENAKMASQVTFNTVYQYWETLPADARPQLYVYGLSLGSFGAQSVLGSVELLNKPIDGALLVGPPFVNPLHTELTQDRDPGTPYWRPVYQHGGTVRFTVQEPTLLDLPGQTATWGPTRLAYLQHGSDAVVFFSPRIFFSEPAWLQGERAPDVSPQVSWFPLVTGWQTLFDLANAGAVPWGYGHLYAASENLTSWAAVSRPPGWTQDELTALGEQLNQLYQGQE
jgi:uncharacterized membrane protein